MSLVTKCDICCEIYSNSTHKDDTAAIRIYDHMSTSRLNAKTIDCCPKCTKKLLEFVDILEKGYLYTIYCEED